MSRPARPARASHPVRTARPARTVRTVAVLVAVLAVGAPAACSSDAAPTTTPADYRAELATICLASSTDRSALADPADAAGVTAFARKVAEVLTREAESARALRAPAELDGDHRALVQNTADQAARWNELATTPIDDERFGTLQNEILELTLGRDDLVRTMGVEACRVTAA